MMLIELTNDRTGDLILVNPNDIASVETFQDGPDVTRTRITMSGGNFRYLFPVETPAQIRDAIQALQDRREITAPAVIDHAPVGPAVETGGLGFGAAQE